MILIDFFCFHDHISIGWFGNLAPTPPLFTNPPEWEVSLISKLFFPPSKKFCSFMKHPCPPNRTFVYIHDLCRVQPSFAINSFPLASFLGCSFFQIAPDAIWTNNSLFYLKLILLCLSIAKTSTCTFTNNRKFWRWSASLTTLAEIYKTEKKIANK